MAKVTLINAPYLEVYGPMRVASAKHFPLGLGYIAAVLRKEGHDIQFLDPEAEGITDLDLVKKVKSYQPDLVGVNCMTANFSLASKLIKKIRPHTKALITMGGVHVSAIPEVTVKSCKELDLACIGEGELTMKEIASLLPKIRNKNKKFKTLSGIKGIAFRDKKGKIHITPPRAFMENLDELPFPARDLVDIHLYQAHAHNARDRRSATMITSRGCPRQCIFCASHIIAGRRFRAHSPKYVVNEIEHLMKKYGIRHIHFQDDTFVQDRNRVVKICRLILAKKLKFYWHCFGHAMFVDEKLLRLMRRAGCYSIGFGVETGDEELLKTIKKATTIDAYRKAFRIANKVGLQTQAFFVFGLPGETRETIEKSIKLAIELKPVLVFFNILGPFPGTEVFNSLPRKTRKSLSTDDFRALITRAVVPTKDLDVEELEKLTFQANIRFYARPSQLFKILFAIRSPYQFFSFLKGGLGLLETIMQARDYR